MRWNLAALSGWRKSSRSARRAGVSHRRAGWHRLEVTGKDAFRICSGLPGAVEDYPFGDGVAVFKVAGRMFALVPVEEEPGSISLKCDPDLALHLRARYEAVQPGYHLNKRHWNTVTLDGSIEDAELEEMIGHSYDLVVRGLPRAERARISRG
ncbi:MAG: MmcQ/YjbR family DNA-binding protein [Chloroflexi bacterium]|nr:MmcQ/YjbR family DNA-binding protein [Chloroflexota bacterium]